MRPIQFTRNVRSLNRLRHIAQVLTRHGFGHFVARANLTRLVPLWMWRKKMRPAAGEEPPSIGRRLAVVCHELGPTFIKFGQVMSTRPDILPAGVIEGLRTLQDEVPPFETAQARRIIEEELGWPVDAAFSSFDDVPVASASIGQVYRATARDGAPLMVKVRRPNIENLIRLDMQLLQWLAESIENLMPELRVYRPAMLVAELDETMRRELDYVNEASTTMRFVRAFEDEPGIRIPHVYWELSGSRVLTAAALKGVNADRLLAQMEAEGDGHAVGAPHPVQGADGTSSVPARHIDRRDVARRLAECYLKQVFELGCFHADPHPGNILIDPPATIGLIDFGQVGTISEDLRTDLVILAYACVHNELGVVVDTFADMGALGRGTEQRSLRRALQVLRDKYYGLPIKRLDVGTLFSEFTELIRGHDVVVPRDLALLIKALGTVGTVTRRFDPDLNLLELLVPRVRKALSERLSPSQVSRTTALMSWDLLSVVRHAPRQLRQLLRRLSREGWEVQVRHENLDRLIGELDRSSNRLAFSVVIAGIIIGSSAVFSAATDLTVFGFRVQYFGIVGYLLAGIFGLGLTWAIFRSGRLH